MTGNNDVLHYLPMHVFAFGPQIVGYQTTNNVLILISE
jgi:hypothetical protein